MKIWKALVLGLRWCEIGRHYIDTDYCKLHCPIKLEKGYPVNSATFVLHSPNTTFVLSNSKPTEIKNPNIVTNKVAIPDKCAYCLENINKEDGMAIANLKNGLFYHQPCFEEARKI